MKMKKLTQTNILWGTAIITCLVLLMSFPAQAAPLDEGQDCRRIIYVLLDISGSYTEVRPQAIDDLKEIVATLRAGDCFILKAISAESFSDSNSLLVLKLPTSSRPIDLGYQRRLNYAKSQAITQMEGLKSRPRSRYTDLWCSIFLSSKVLQNSSCEKHLVIFSDLKDNCRKRACKDFRLDGVEVSVRRIPRSRDDDPFAFEKRIRQWVQVFKQAGVAGMSFSDTDGLPLLEERAK
jgi:hypothetical protein